MKFTDHEDLRKSSVYVTRSDDMTMYASEYREFLRSLYLRYIRDKQGLPVSIQDIIDEAGDVYIWTDAYKMQKLEMDFSKFGKDLSIPISSIDDKVLIEHVGKKAFIHRINMWEDVVNSPSKAIGQFITYSLQEIAEYQRKNKVDTPDKPRVLFINTGFWALQDQRKLLSALITSFANDYITKNNFLTIVLYGTNIPVEVQNASYPTDRERLNKTRIKKMFSKVKNVTTLKAFEAFCNYCEDMVYTDIFIIKTEIEKKAEFEERELDTKEVIQIIEKFRRLRIEATGMLEYLNAEPKGLDAYGGKKDLKAFVTQTISEVVMNPEDAAKYGVNAPDGVLLVSRIAGTGKSWFARCLAGELGIPVFNFRMGSVMSKYVGESEQMMETAIQALKSVGKCILYIDEIDQIGIRQESSGDSGVTRRLFSRFLEFAGESDREVILIGSTNEIRHIDRAMLRKGRFSHIIFLDLPNEKERAEILKIQVGLQSKLPNKIDYDFIATLTENYTPAELTALVKEAITFQWHDAKLNGEEKLPLSTKHFLYALDVIKVNLEKRKQQLELEKLEKEEFATPLINYIAMLKKEPKTKIRKTKSTKRVDFAEGLENE